jgi:hypothetical protein
MTWTATGRTRSCHSRVCARPHSAVLLQNSDTCGRSAVLREPVSIYFNTSPREQHVNVFTARVCARHEEALCGALAVSSELMT